MLFLRWLIARLNERYTHNRKPIVDNYMFLFAILTSIYVVIIIFTFDTLWQEKFRTIYLIAGGIWLIVALPLMIHYIIVVSSYLKKIREKILTDYRYYKENYGNLKDWNELK